MAVEGERDSTFGVSPLWMDLADLDGTKEAALDGLIIAENSESEYLKSDTVGDCGDTSLYPVFHGLKEYFFASMYLFFCWMK